MKAAVAVREAKREAEYRFDTMLSQNFEGKTKMYLKELKRVQKVVQGEELRVKDRDDYMLVEGMPMFDRLID